jgi:hypothetical protein
MRKVCIRELPNQSVLLSLNKFFYVLDKVKDQSYRVKSLIEREGTVHFEVFAAHDVLAFTDESNKIVGFYSVKDLLDTANSNKLPKVLH